MHELPIQPYVPARWYSKRSNRTEMFSLWSKASQSKEILKGGEVHSYKITLTTGLLARVVVDQRGIDIVATLFAPDNAKLVEVDSPNGARVKPDLGKKLRARDWWV